MNEAIVVELLAAVNSMRKDLTHHMEDEEGEITGMKSSISKLQTDLVEWRLAAEKRHSDLIGALEHWTAKVDCSDAFITTPDGKKDLQGHKDDHLTRKQFAEEINDLKKNTRKVVVGAGATGVMTWLFYIIWEAFLRGPN